MTKVHSVDPQIQTLALFGSPISGAHALYTPRENIAATHTGGSLDTCASSPPFFLHSRGEVGRLRPTCLHKCDCIRRRALCLPPPLLPSPLCLFARQ